MNDNECPIFVDLEVAPRIAAHLKAGDHVVLLGHHGSGKSRQSEAALNLVSASNTDAPVVRIGPTSRLPFAELLRNLAEATNAVVLIDRPGQLNTEMGEAIARSVTTRNTLLVIEAESRSALPPPLERLLLAGRYSTVTLDPPDRDESRDWLAERLGGPVPADEASYVWRATGGNPELLGMLAQPIEAGGMWERGEYAWRWTSSIDVPLEDIPASLVQHVQRQFQALGSTQQRYLSRLALCGSIDLQQSCTLIEDLQLAELEDKGFVRRFRRRDRALVLQLRAPIFGWVIERGVQPGFRDEVFAGLAPPARDREDPTAVLAWGRLALHIGAVLSAEQIALGNEAAFTLLRWNHIEEAVDVVIPANLMEREVVARLFALDDEERHWRVLLLLQRGLSYYFRDLYDLARADMRTVHAVVEQDPWVLGTATYHLVQLEIAVGQSDSDPRALGAVFDRGIRFAERAGDQLLADNFRIWRLSTRNEDALRRMPLPDLERVLDEHLGDAPFAVSIAPHAALRLALSGRFSDAVALFKRIISLRELRITDLPSNAHSFALAELVVMRGYACLLVARTDEALSILSDDIVRTILDPSAYELLVAAAHAARGQWDQAHRTLSGVLERLNQRDHNRSMKLALSMFALVSAARGDELRATEALRRAEELPFGRLALLESMMDYWLLVARAGLGQPDLGSRIDEYLEKFALAGEWFSVLRAAHLGAAVAEADERAAYLRAMVTAAEHVEAEVSQAFLRDAHAMQAGDAALLAVTRADLSRLGVWIPHRQTLVVLSQRQREIAGLVVGGLANRDIAERLYLSVRTVESHVAAVLGKFGISDRRQLANQLATISPRTDRPTR